MSSTAESNREISATSRAVEQIRQMIFTGELTADSNHLERELAERLGISRTPVREATLMLQAQGLVEVRPRRGVRIKSVSVQDMHEIFMVLTELECLSVRLAARSNYSESDLAGLLDSIEDMNVALSAQDIDAWAAADERFHVQLVNLSRNKRIESVVRNFHDQVKRVRTITLHERPEPIQSTTDHRAVCEAIIQGDAHEADRLHRVHCENARNLLLNILEDSGQNEYA